MTDQIENIELDIIKHKCQSTGGLSDGLFNYTIESKEHWAKNISFYAQKYNTGNCQMFTIAYFKKLLYSYNKENILFILNRIFNDIHKRIALIDITEHDYDKFLKLELENDLNILFNTLYDSTNGSKMRLIGFTLKK